MHCPAHADPTGVLMQASLKGKPSATLLAVGRVWQAARGTQEMHETGGTLHSNNIQSVLNNNALLTRQGSMQLAMCTRRQQWE